ncbi:hypothetical protein FB451DRAFT_1286288 [Mycena latifolia]|nr:hypothetical protein FB451DRAFT_1286288 [Mycena latifolia]
MPEYEPEEEYSLDLGAESTPIDEIIAVPIPAAPPPVPAAPPRTRSWRSSSHAADTAAARASAYDAAGNLKIAARGRAEAQRDCGICEGAAMDPVRTLCCGKVFCREHIEDWLYSPASTGLCPACAAPCILPGESGSPRAPPSSRVQSRAASPVRPVAPRRASGLRPSITSDPDVSILPDLEPESADEDAALRVRRAHPPLAPGPDSLVRALSVLGLLLLLAVLSWRGEERGVGEVFSAPEDGVGR